MPAYLFTFHAYRSWNPDNPRGFVQRGKGIQPPNHNLARAYDAVAGAAPMIFRREHQRVLIWVGYDVCARRGWRLHFTATEPTHVHYLVSWRGSEPWDQVSTRIKNIASLMLGRKLQRRQNKWFSKSGSRKRVRDRGHFLYLMNEYMPRHSGLKWREVDDPLREPDVKKPSAAASGY
ncbi:MAG: hypothetical protein IIB53_10280 [Planctomycetes bacterium]|nr:hypothetical protein [Planctomycetota bacterium]